MGSPITVRCKANASSIEGQSNRSEHYDVLKVGERYRVFGFGFVLDSISFLIMEDNEVWYPTFQPADLFDDPVGELPWGLVIQSRRSENGKLLSLAAVPKCFELPDFYNRLLAKYPEEVKIWEDYMKEINGTL
jgi:hypothetical protein